MNFDSVVLAIILIFVGIFVIKKLPNLIVLTILGFSIAFTSVFVLRDMLHLPVNDYVDTTKMDEFRWGTQDYVDNKKQQFEKKVVDGDYSKFICGRKINTEKNILDDINLVTYSYDQLSVKKRMEIVYELKNKIADERFEVKFLGMSPYVDLKYDLGNAEMFNSDDKKEIIIQFK